MQSSPLRWLATVLCALALAGCAISKPPSTVPPTGWPDAPVTTQPSATPSLAVTLPSATPSARTSAKAGAVTADGVTVTIPAGYKDTTASMTAPPDSGATNVVAQLSNDAGRTITVLTRTSDYSDLTAFLDFYVPALNAGADQTVENRRSVTIGGREGAELTLKSKADGHAGRLFVTLRESTLVMVSGDTPDTASLTTITRVATGLVIG